MALDSLIETDDINVVRGGPGSGHFGHAGRPGEIGGSLPGGNFAATPQQLSTNELRLGRAGRRSMGGINESYLVHVKDDGKAIIKPQQRMHNARMILNEEAAYLLAQELGFNIVPPTTVRDRETYPYLDGEPGEFDASVQLWIDDALLGGEMRSEHYAIVDKRTFSQMVLMDVLMENRDRHGGNFLYKQERIIAIDNNLGFMVNDNEEAHVKYSLLEDAAAIWVDEAPGELSLAFHPDDLRAAINITDNQSIKNHITKNMGANVWGNVVTMADFIAAHEDEFIEGISPSQALEWWIAERDG